MAVQQISNEDLTSLDVELKKEGPPLVKCFFQNNSNGWVIKLRETLECNSEEFSIDKYTQVTQLRVRF